MLWSLKSECIWSCHVNMSAPLESPNMMTSWNIHKSSYMWHCTQHESCFSHPPKGLKCTCFNEQLYILLRTVLAPHISCLHMVINVNTHPLMSSKLLSIYLPIAQGNPPDTSHLHQHTHGSPVMPSDSLFQLILQWQVIWWRWHVWLWFWHWNHQPEAFIACLINRHPLTFGPCVSTFKHA